MARPRILLIQPPFGIHFQPSLGLGRIKAVLRAEGFPCEIAHINLELALLVGEGAYYWISNHPWRSDFIYASELFPDHLSPQKLHHLSSFSTALTQRPSEVGSLPALLRKIRQFNRNILDRWRKSFPYDLVGINANFHLLPALFFARHLKRLHPEVPLVIGGGQCINDVGRAIAHKFPFVDWVVTGEGENAMLEIARLCGKMQRAAPKGTCCRVGSKIICSQESSAPVDLEALPVPDYDDYFFSDAVGRFRSIISIPMECARGCWWGKCAFCSHCAIHVKNRRLSDNRIVETMELLSKRYKSLRFAFNDEMQPPAVEGLAAALKASPFDFRFSIELRSDIASEQLQALAEAGLDTCAFGVESFSSRHLKRMCKGTDALQNVYALRESRRLGIDATFCLMRGYPGETHNDRKRTQAIMERIPHLIYKIHLATFGVQYNSLIYRHPERFGIKRIWPSHIYSMLLPAEYLFAPTFYWEYSPRKDIPLSAWEHNVAYEWNMGCRGNLVQSAGDDEFCLVSDSRWHPAEYTFLPPYCDILVACTTPRARCELACSDKVIKEMLSRRLLIEEDGRYLSLAVGRRG